MNGNNPAPDPYVTVSCTEAPLSNSPRVLCIGGHVGGRRGGQGCIKLVSKIKLWINGCWLLLLALLSGLVSSGFFGACLSLLSCYCSVLFDWLFVVCCSWSSCILPQGSSSFCFSCPPDICLCEPLLVLVIPIFLSLLFFLRSLNFLN